MQAIYQEEHAQRAPGGAVRRWPLWLIAAPAAVAVWSGWVGLGQLCGFGIVHPLPGIMPGVQLDTAITLPVGVEAYASFALGAWLHPGVPQTARRFARNSALGALGLGMLGQVAYHVLASVHAHRAPWPVVVLVACMPVVTLGYGVALAHLLRTQDTPETATAAAEPASVDLLTARSRPSLRLAWPVPPAAAPAALPRHTRRASRKRTRRAPVTNDDAALRYVSEIESGRIPSMHRVRAEMRVGQARAQAIVAHLGAALAEAG